jgi:hypothetical protein
VATVSSSSGCLSGGTYVPGLGRQRMIGPESLVAAVKTISMYSPGIRLLAAAEVRAGSSPSGSHAVQTLFASGRIERSVMKRDAESSRCLDEPWVASRASTLLRMSAVSVRGRRGQPPKQV